MVEFATNEEEAWSLTAEGQSILREGSHEVKVFNFIPAGETGVAVTAIKVIKGSLESFVDLNALSLFWVYRNLWVNLAKLDKAKPSRTSGSG